MDVVLQYVCNCAIFVNSDTVLDSNRWVAERASFEAVFRIVAIDCSFSKPLHFLVTNSAVNDVHSFSHMDLNDKELSFEYLDEIALTLIFILTYLI